MSKITAYTDGSCYYKSRLGGYGVYIFNDQTKEETFINNGFSNTTISRMELMGMITCLKTVKKHHKLTVYCDSEYVVKCITERRLFNWKNTNFIGIKNPDLMKQYFKEFKKFTYPPKIIHIRGHQNKDNIHSLGNAIADELANYKQFKEYKEDIVNDN